MADIPVQFTPQSIPAGLCFANDQERLNWFVNNGLVGTVTGQYSGVIIQPTTPTVNERTFVWLQTTGDGSPIRLFRWSDAVGNWVWPHPSPASGDERRIWVGSTGDLETYEGGVAGAATDASGPFWEVDGDFAARSPIGVGTLPISATVLAVGDTFGEERHTQSVPELAEHTHVGKANSFWAWESGANTGPGNNSNQRPSNAGDSIVENTGDSQPFNVVHPVRTVYFIRRTARVYYTP